MPFPRPLFAAVAATSIMTAASAHALVVHFDPASFNFYVNEPSYGYSNGLNGPAEIYPVSGTGYVVDGVQFVEFGTNGETLTFGADTTGQYQLVAPEKLWTVTDLYTIPSLNSDLDKVDFNTKLLSTPQTLNFTNPATGQIVVVTVSLSSAVPEPATWALMLIGFGGLGAAIRVRRSSLAVV